jgi:hypothetical protein
MSLELAAPSFIAVFSQFVPESVARFVSKRERLLQVFESSRV